MDQKNTIVKCAMHKCLFNNCGTCDQYVITIGIDGKCAAYCETASEEDMKNGVIGEFKGYSITKPDKPITLKMAAEEFNKLIETTRCHDDCIHFDDSDPMMGPICLFQHPEPLKEFYDGMPCDYYHKRLSESFVDLKKYKRGQRAKYNLYEDGWVDPEIVEEVCKPFSDWDEASAPDICKTCKKNPHNNKCPWKNIAYGIWTCYEGNICLECEHSIDGACKFSVIPMKDPNGKCCRFSRR